MPIIDLTTDEPTSVTAPATADATDAVAAAPRRIGLTLPELQAAAALAGDAPLPFAVADSPSVGAMESRLGGTPANSDDAAFRSVIAGLPAALPSLERRGLVTDGALDAGPAGALGLLATPEVAIDVDVAFPGTRLRSWHRQAGDAVAALATTDGMVFELSWFPADAWAAELSRTVAPPEEVALDGSEVPAYLDLPLDLAEAVADAVGTGRGDLVDVLLGRGAPVRGADGDLSPGAARRALQALSTEARGRMRALAAKTPGDAAPRTIGVVSWSLVGDGWRRLRSYRTSEGPRVEIGAADPADLAASLAPSLAVTR